MSRRYDPTRARTHWYYTREHLCELFNVCDTTITNWKNAGLTSIANGRFDIFHGVEVRRHICRLRWGNAREPRDGRLYCTSCCRFVSVLFDSIDQQSDEPRRDAVTGRCTQCDSTVKGFVSQRQVREVIRAAVKSTGDTSAI